jgi:hypothetical protein
MTQNEDGRFARNAANLAVEKLIRDQIANDDNTRSSKALDDCSQTLLFRCRLCAQRTSSIKCDELWVMRNQWI